MKKIGIIGAGVMGVGVAQKFAQKCYEIVLIDINDEILEQAKENIMKNVMLYNMFNKNEKIEDTSELLDRIKFSTDYEELASADVIIENVPEILEIKKDVYIKLEQICKNECIYLVNTSCISITKIASYTNRADKVIGTHFMNPVPMKKFVEVIKGLHTTDETIGKTSELLSSVGMHPIIVNDYPGFVSNRISHLFMNEAAYTVQDGVSTPADVDQIFKSCFEHKMGPLETADLIGLDTVVNSLDILYQSYQDPKFRCCPLLRKMVDAGQLGRKSGKGFYEYN
ncbi:MULTISPECIES: 3-hydroxyacyl-CoA dehydrogenase family protein [Bacillus]|uniref:3-hydroxyacyl-CoA dehydrogenase family protein n=1 Tax=Bacillus cereus TaxID=1396 RepID=A0AAN5XNX1_BACCE|nr:MULTISPECIES: 3-hydroxyacyl-CoA dehydrogenase family protein [Bacillus cereus group]KAB2447918.1 3-hydroxyacyl-CoA dehydrogenase family protein [Bacillus cereus]KAB2484503.1 3-hydroxyacyl-CoA dehydrogenase family protein [Bacillus cereus]PHG45628.1 3-hydroxybutyryl-CoA dehydrogenase [Bacillus wiedmannii]